jgi:hypothetical protein
VAFCHDLLVRSINCDTKQDEKDDRRGAGRRSRHEDDQEMRRTAPETALMRQGLLIGESSFVYRVVKGSQSEKMFSQ